MSRSWGGWYDARAKSINFIFLSLFLRRRRRSLAFYLCGPRSVCAHIIIAILLYYGKKRGRRDRTTTTSRVTGVFLIFFFFQTATVFVN